MRARIVAKTSSYLRADAVEVVEASPARVRPRCPHAGPGRCGGCDWQHIALAEQRRLKGELVAEQLLRLAGIEYPLVVEPVPGDADGLGWRTRVRFAVHRSGRVGFRRNGSHEIENIEVCPIAAPAIEELHIPLSRWHGVREIEVFSPNSTDLEGVMDENSHKAVVAVQPRGRGALRNLPQVGTSKVELMVATHHRDGAGRLEVSMLGRSFRISPGAFWQVHRGAPRTLVTAVLEGLAPQPNERALDLYAGVGLFSAFLADSVGLGGSVIAVEQDRRACADARINTREQPQVQIVNATISPEVIEGLDSPDIVVLDPPRSGIGRANLQALMALQPPPRRIAYLSCDPATFARDIRIALDAGWSMPHLRAFDQFPMTEHVELLALLDPP
ncbi:MAG: rRNA methyltransferase/RumA [Acidimicrobiaceae bacterium]|nr:rRNA methyltransferase/RumA [Acidimicrobiaceae bacterium]